MDNKLQRSRKIVLIALACILAAVISAVGVFYAASTLIGYGNSTMFRDDDLPEAKHDLPKAEEELIAKNMFSADGFYEIGGIRYYYHGGQKGIPGIDVSSYQQNIDWQEVKQAGVEFAMIRVGYRGWTSGELALDDHFISHIEGALAADIKVGVYFFSQALTVEEAVEEAQFTLAQIKDYEISYPVVFDWEEVEAESARTNDMDMRMLTSCAEAFCRTVSESGYTGGVYFNQAYGYDQLNLPSISDYTFWLAEYAPHPSFEYGFQMWQYTNEGSVPGIEGNVDLNIAFETK